MDKESGGEDSRRYYPAPMEQSVLLKHIAQYFSYPERSVERNKVAADVSAILSKMSNHWTHRAVRLWFNNNRHSYKTDISNIGNAGKRQPLVRFSSTDHQLAQQPQNMNQMPNVISPSTPINSGFSSTFSFPNNSPVSPLPQNFDQNISSNT